MIKRLRRRFVLASMLSVFLVLLITVGAINVSNYVTVENNASMVLSAVIEQGPNEGMGPGGGPGQPGGPADPRQEHYFITVFDSKGNVTASNTRHMFAYSEAECAELATKVYRNELTGGKYDTLRYGKSTKADGLTYVAFADMKERLDSASSFLLVSSVTSAVAYLVFVGLILLASKIVFKPSEEAYRKQKRFITNASHELKTPLTVISADMDLVEMDHGKSEWTESIRDQIKRLTEMTNQLVTLSKLEEEDASFPFEDFSLNEVCEKAASSFAPGFKKEGIAFSFNLAQKITMHGNRRLIEELVYVMLDNSLKYTGGDKKASYFTLSQGSKGQIELRFSNTLDKADEVDPSQMLDRFYRSPTSKKEGSGVGLSIAKEVVNLHKGKINAEKDGNTLSFLISFKA